MNALRHRIHIISISIVLLALFLALPAHAQQAPLRCCVPEASATGGTAVNINSCRLVETNRPCQVRRKPTRVCRNDSTNTVLIQDSCPSDDWVISTLDLIEREVDCTQEPRCRNSAAISQQIVNCGQFSVSQCPEAVCFVSGGKCYHQRDGNICDRVTNKTECDKSKVCSWKNDRCLSALEATLSGQYNTQNTGGFLPPCAIDGTCRNTNDILRVLLNYGARIFSLLGVFAFVMFVYGGITMITSFGSPERFKKGQQILVAAIIGVVISLSAYLLVDFVLDTIGVTSQFRVIQ